MGDYYNEHFFFMLSTLKWLANLSDMKLQHILKALTRHAPYKRLSGVFRRKTRRNRPAKRRRRDESF